MSGVTRKLPPFTDAPLHEGDTKQFSTAWTAFLDDQAYRLDHVGRGVVDGSEAKAGDVGEFAQASGSGVAVPGAGYTNVATLSLPAGDWDIAGSVQFTAGGGVTGFNVLASISTGSAAPSGVLQRIQTAFPAAFVVVISAGGPARLNLTAATDVFLVAGAGFAGGGVTAAGSIWARRAR